MYIASAGLITIAHYMSFIYVEAEKNGPLVESIFDDTDSIQRLGLHLVAQGKRRGSHSSWKTWKNDNSFSSPGKVLEFYNFIKNPGKMGVNLEK